LVGVDNDVEKAEDGDKVTLIAQSNAMRRQLKRVEGLDQHLW